MKRYPAQIIEKARQLRSFGKTYSEIRTSLKINSPKSTLSYWCRGVQLPPEYIQFISSLNKETLNKARKTAVAVNRIKREAFFKSLEEINKPIAGKINDIHTAKIALAMLCLGEASKYNGGRSKTFYLGNSDPKIISMFLSLLKKCFDFHLEKVRCTVQCRADQDTEELKEYWSSITHVPKKLFYKPLIDPRTKGKPTHNKEYKGVLRVDY